MSQAPVEIKLHQQIGMLRDMTRRTGAIHEAQVLQLRMWPRLFAGSTSSETKVDAEKKIVTYEVSGKISKSAKNKRLINELNRWTKELLWAETTVIIKFNGKVVFDSRV